MLAALFSRSWPWQLPGLRRGDAGGSVSALARRRRRSRRAARDLDTSTTGTLAKARGAGGRAGRVASSRYGFEEPAALSTGDRASCGQAFATPPGCPPRILFPTDTGCIINQYGNRRLCDTNGQPLHQLTRRSSISSLTEDSAGVVDATSGADLSEEDAGASGVQRRDGHQRSGTARCSALTPARFRQT